MAYSRLVYTYTGGPNVFAVNFTLGYLSQSHVTARVNNEVDGLSQPVYRSLTWLTPGTVQVNGAALVNGDVVVLQRTTPKDAVVHDYANGEVLTEANIDQSFLQPIMIAHEALDGRLDTMQADLNMGSFKITNMADGIVDTDAANMRQLNATIATANATLSSASGYATAAGNSASAAANSAASAAASYDSLDDRYLGPKASNPSVDNDGAALIEGALYWNTVSKEMRVWNGSTWAATYLPAGAYLLRAGDATTGLLRSDSGFSVGGNTNTYGFEAVAASGSKGYRAQSGSFTLDIVQSATTSFFSAGGSASGTMEWWINGARQLFLSPSGLGVNTTMMDGKLTVDGSVAVRSGNYFMMRPTDNSWDMRINALSGDNRIAFYSGGAPTTPLAVIDTSGNIGTGAATTPTEAFHAERTTAVNVFSKMRNSLANVMVGVLADGRAAFLQSNAYDMIFQTNNTVRQTLKSTGSIQFGGATEAAGYTAAGDITLPTGGKISAFNCPKFLVNMWVQASPTVRKSMNVASVTRTAAGRGIITLTNATTDIDSVFAGIAAEDVSFGPGGRQISAVQLTTTTVQYFCGQTAATTEYDTKYAHLVGYNT